MRDCTVALQVLVYSFLVVNFVNFKIYFILESCFIVLIRNHHSGNYSFIQCIKSYVILNTASHGHKIWRLEISVSKLASPDRQVFTKHRRTRKLLYRAAEIGIIETTIRIDALNYVLLAATDAVLCCIKK